MGQHLAGLAASLGLGLLACAAPPPPLPPGSPVVLVVVDTLRADHLGAYGYGRPTSRELDGWTARGALFERAFATAPWTLPSVGSLLTGRYPQRHGAGRFKQSKEDKPRRNVGLDPTVPTLASVLAEHDYATAGFVTNTFLRPPFGLHKGFDSYDSHGHKGSSLRPAGMLVDAALEWLDEQEGPFFLLLHIMDPHLPYGAPPPAQGRFAGDAAGRFRRPVGEMKKIRRAHPPLKPAERQFVESLYDEEVAYADHHVGRFLDGLDERGLLERALVVFAADHGEEFWEHGGYEHGHAFFQELLHVPLVFWGPGIEPARLDVPVSQVDVLPTVIDALGLPEPGAADGVSLWPLLTGGSAPDARVIVAQNSLRGAERHVVVAWPWKLITHLGRVQTGPMKPHLYNLEDDPGELENLQAEEQGRVKDLRAQLRELLPDNAVSERGRVVDLDPELREELEALGYLEE